MKNNYSTTIKKIILSIGIALFISSAIAQNAGITNYNQTGTGPGTFENGIEFTVNYDITITDLGAYDFGSDGMSASTPVTIWNTATSSAVATVTIPAGTSATLDNEMRYASITPVVLTAGSTYRITSYGSEGFCGGTIAPTATPLITVNSGVYTSGTAAGYPTNTIGSYYFGANFYYTPVSSASTAAITNYNSTTTITGTPLETGVEFTVNSDINVIQLGAFDLNNDGMAAATPVTIWDAGGSVIATATVPAGTSAVLDNGTRYVSITPVTLTSGNTYTVSSYGSEGYLYSTANPTTIPEITVTDGVYLNTGSAGFPNTVGGAYYYGGNFHYSLGCDQYSYQNMSACGSATINGTTYTSSQTVADLFSSGCDSTHITYLTIIPLPTVTASGAATICDGQSTNLTAGGASTYAWNNSAGTGSPVSVSPSTTTTYTVTGTDANTCVNTAQVTVTVNALPDVTVTAANNLLTANESGATYQWLDCPAMTPISGATNQFYTAPTNGDYAVIVTNNGCSETSTCYTVTGVGIIENDFGSGLLLYPNPTDGYFSIDLGENSQLVTVTMTDLSGKVIQSKTYSNKQLLNLKTEEPSGVYLLVIESGTKKAVIRLVKE